MEHWIIVSSSLSFSFMKNKAVISWEVVVELDEITHTSISISICIYIYIHTWWKVCLHSPHPNRCALLSPPHLRPSLHAARHSPCLDRPVSELPLSSFFLNRPQLNLHSLGEPSLTSCLICVSLYSLDLCVPHVALFTVVLFPLIPWGCRLHDRGFFCSSPLPHMAPGRQ